MPGTIVFRPIEATLPKARRGSIDTYLSFTAGDQKGDSEKCSEGGNHLHWNDSVTLKVKDQHTCLIELKDQEETGVGSLGSLELNLDEIEEKGTVRRWYPIYENNKNIGEVLLEASFTSEEHRKSEPSTTSTSAVLDTSLHSIEDHIKHQGSVPKGLDLDEYFRERSRWGLEPINSQVRVAETNEFGDYQPMKQMPFGDLKNGHGAGRMEQGSYYSGQQTSYGEAYPMTHKSVGTNQLGNLRPDRGEAYDRINPKGYAMYMSQAFDEHDQYNFVMDDFDAGNKVTSVVEKAYQQSKQFQPMRKASTSHSARVSLGTLVEPSDMANEQYHDLKGSTSNRLPYKTNEYGNLSAQELIGQTAQGAMEMQSANQAGKSVGEFEATRMNVGGSDTPMSSQ